MRRTFTQPTKNSHKTKKRAQRNLQKAPTKGKDVESCTVVLAGQGMPAKGEQGKGVGIPIF